MVFALHYDRGDYGPGDFLEVDTQQNIPGHGLVWAPAAIIADSNSIVDLQKFIYAGLPPVNNIVKVKNFELQVYRIGKVVFAYWIVPITSAAVTLPLGAYCLKETAVSKIGIHNICCQMWHLALIRWVLMHMQLCSVQRGGTLYLLEIEHIDWC